jgi:Methyltransferase domain
MRPSEARYIGEILARLADDDVSPCVNIGSSTGQFRRVLQPHIQQYIFSPLEARGVRIVHADLKAAEGVDIVGNIYAPAVVDEIRRQSPKLVLCCNMLEHVDDRGALVAMLTDIVPSDGRLVVTVPHSYPLHYDPIDTYFRPTPQELAELFSAFELVKGDIVVDVTYGFDLLSELGAGGMLVHFAKSAIKFFMVWRGKRAWTEHFHRYLWLWRPYSVSCVVLRKAAS